MLRRTTATAVRATRMASMRTTSRFMSSTIPTDEQQATGEEKTEQATLKQGVGFQRGAVTGPFGTLEKPMLVPSALSKRIVGCTGGVEGTHAHHDVIWFEIEKNELWGCPECAQVFKLVDNDVYDAALDAGTQSIKAEESN